MMSDYDRTGDELSEQLVSIAAAAALEVGDMLVEAAIVAARGSVAKEQKENNHDLVTEYDRKSEQMIAEYIVQQLPDSTIIGEESGARGEGAVHWYIDPIDGTSNFAAGIPFFCVSIGAVIERVLLAGVIFDPVRGELFSATPQGSYLNGEPIRACGSKFDSQALLLTAFPSPHTGVSSQDAALFGHILERFATVRRVGSAALSLAYVACGRADVMYEPYINPWDVAAGMLLVEQAGGQVLAFGSSMTAETTQVWLRPKIIAACPEFDLEQSILNTFFTRT